MLIMLVKGPMMFNRLISRDLASKAHCFCYLYRRVMSVIAQHIHQLTSVWIFLNTESYKTCIYIVCIQILAEHFHV